MKKAIIIGIKGQDGQYLEKLLLKKKYKIIGIGKDFISPNNDKVNITNFFQLNNLIKNFKPNEIYYLAAHHHSSEDDISDNLLIYNDSLSINVNGFINCLESVRLFSNKTKIFYAASHHVFGFNKRKINNENTPLAPQSIYGISKSMAINLCKYYKKKYGTFVSIGYLYNHESPLRKNNFLSKKVINFAFDIKKGKSKKLYIGNLKAKIDWGYAKDYVDAMYRIMQLDYPDDFIICSDNIETISKYVESIFKKLGLNYKNYVIEKPEIIKKEKQIFIPGDNSKIKSMTNWYPKTNFNELIEILLNNRIK